MNILKIAGLAAVFGMTTSAMAITLTTGNSTVEYNPTSGAGMTDWKVDGVDQLTRQWFWYRVGSQGDEANISTLANSTTVLDSDPTTFGNDMARTVFTSSSTAPGFKVSILYTLTGGAAGSGTADIAETITIQNLSGAALDFHFFQYSDFDLSGTANNDVGAFPNGNLVAQWDATSSKTLSETIMSPSSSHGEINTPTALQAKFTDGSPTTLSDLPSVGGGTVGPANIAWVFEWDFNIAAGSSVIISKDKRLSQVPDSGSTMALLGAALTAMSIAGRRMRRS